jgi:hypothetical protein
VSPLSGRAPDSVLFGAAQDPVSTIPVDEESLSLLERRRRLFGEVFADFDARGVGLRMADNLPRASLHNRSVTPSDCTLGGRRARYSPTE